MNQAHNIPHLNVTSRFMQPDISGRRIGVGLLICVLVLLLHASSLSSLTDWRTFGISRPDVESRPHSNYCEQTDLVAPLSRLSHTAQGHCCCRYVCHTCRNRSDGPTIYCGNRDGVTSILGRESSSSGAAWSPTRPILVYTGQTSVTDFDSIAHCDCGHHHTKCMPFCLRHQRETCESFSRRTCRS